MIAQRTNETPAGTGGATSTQSAAGGALETGAAGSSSASAPGTASRGRSRPAPAMPGGGPGGQSGRGQSGLPDAKDDDIIARQLREAAMAEPDPVLREKLWEEYRRYKGS